MIELRYRRSGGGMGQRFFPARRPAVAAGAAVRLARQCDVYFGVCPRDRREGTRNAVARAWALWVDCDDVDAVEELRRFDPAPAIVVRSGTLENRHAYWPLSLPLDPVAAEAANRCLARTLGADLESTDAGRVLRPAGTLNHKNHPATPVVLERLTGEVFDRDELLAAFGAQTDRVDLAPTPPSRGDTGTDLLRRIAPVIYVAVLIGQEVPKHRKVSCPLHPDRTPSLHAYETAEEGWFCFGCRRGGSVYDLGAALFGLSASGREFHELRRRLYSVLLPGQLPPRKELDPNVIAPWQPPEIQPNRSSHRQAHSHPPP